MTYATHIVVGNHKNRMTYVNACQRAKTLIEPQNTKFNPFRTNDSVSVVLNSRLNFLNVYQLKLNKAFFSSFDVSYKC